MDISKSEKMTKKILILTDWVYPVVGGTEQHCFGLAKHLVNKGFNVRILAPNWDGSKKPSEAEGVRIHWFKGPLIRFGLIRLIYYLWNALKLDLKEDFDVMHSFYMANIFVSCIITAKIRGKKCIITLFEEEPLLPYLSNPLSRNILLWILGKADYITALNWTLGKKIKKLFPKHKKKVLTIPNWVDLNSFNPRKKRGNIKTKTILFTGRLCKQKGCEVLIRALPLIRKKIAARLVFVGPPWNQKEYEELANKLGVRKYIDFKGFIKTRKELVKEYQQCDLMTYPTLAKGGFGFTIMEAIACGKPVVGSDDTGIPDAIGNAGLVSRRGDERSLAEQAIRVFSEKGLYERLQGNALKRAKEFSEEKIISKYIELYKKGS